jgi:hypothetical protein
MHTRYRVIGMTAAVLILAACATPAPTVKPTTAAQTDPTCLTSTGTRIPVTGTDCSAIGRSYSNDDLDRTGATTVGGGLRLLDPALTIQH